MAGDAVIIKGNKEGLNVVIDTNNFRDFDDILQALKDKLAKGKKFYKGSTIKITTELKSFDDKKLRIIKDALFEDFLIKDCIFEDIEEKKNKVFSGIYEGRTKFIRATVRSGQYIDYPGNVVVIGDVNPGAEIHASGNVIVVGRLKGHVFAGVGGNEKAIIAAYSLQPQILQIANIVTRSPEDGASPKYPEVAKIKEGMIIVEPYLPNKYY